MPGLGRLKRTNTSASAHRYTTSIPRSIQTFRREVIWRLSENQVLVNPCSGSCEFHFHPSGVPCYTILCKSYSLNLSACHHGS
uniref:Uncharacterized protein n=1 Tax=Anopheles atroparvus TaxID=41427 RepID=A0AAG5CUB0_ANOAO